MAGALYVVLLLVASVRGIYVPVKLFFVPGNLAAGAARSLAGFLPRFLGVLLAITGVAWVVSSVGFFALPTPSAQRFAAMIMPVLTGELVVICGC